MAVIYVYSKPNCSQCDTAISLLLSKNKVHKVKKLDIDYTLQSLCDMISPVVPRSFPQIIVDDFGEIEYIGGLPELIQYLKRTV